MLITHVQQESHLWSQGKFGDKTIVASKLFPFDSLRQVRKWVGTHMHTCMHTYTHPSIHPTIHPSIPELFPRRPHHEGLRAPHGRRAHPGQQPLPGTGGSAEATPGRTAGGGAGRTGDDQEPGMTHSWAARGVWMGQICICIYIYIYTYNLGFADDFWLSPWEIHYLGNL